MKPKEDPALKAQEEQSRLEQIEAIQQDVTRRTNDSMRRYGNRSASAPIMR
ncbi:hypothetical protein ACJKIH_03010 [Brucella pseudogrignonensis]|uniref:hypothetical protein n=1 Tax=Brucella pseudogrignonensis TaxID=419475 RepID=UPI0038B57A39